MIFKNIAVIPARLGSKRIKEKNIKLFNSKPIIYWTYKVLLESKIFSKIYVSTESKKIKSVCKKFGLNNFINRPKKLSGDYITIKAVMEHAELELSRKINYRNICCIFPCNPLLNIKNLKIAEKILVNRNNTIVKTVAKYRHPIERALTINNKKEVKPLFFNNMSKMTQEFKTKYHDAGQFYFSKKNVWLNESKKIKSVGIEMSHSEFVDIDNLEDWKLLEQIYKFRKNVLKKKFYKK